MVFGSKRVNAVACTAAVLLAGGVQASKVLKDVKMALWDHSYEIGVLGRSFNSVRSAGATCNDDTKSVEIDGETFACDQVDFSSFISLQEMDITSVPHKGNGIASADIWGWLSPSGKEITLMCMDNGMAVVDTTDPVNPCVFGLLASNRRADPWADVKVYSDTAYIVKDSRGGDFANDTTAGGQVLDLLPFDDIVCSSLSEPLTLEADFEWDFHGSSHNLVVNTETGFLYSVGGDVCSGGFVVMDLKNDRLRPEFVGCVDGDGYTHDAQCVVYDGPDLRFTGREICFAFNEDTLTIWDLTFKLAPVMLSRLEYPGQVYAHQGWLTDDMSLMLLDDELNEWCADPVLSAAGFCSFLPLGPSDGETRTSTVGIDVNSLTNPIYTGKYLHENPGIDHNLYVWSLIHRTGQGGNPPLPASELPSSKFAYLNNYADGLRILDVSSNDVNQFTEVGFFDISPDISGIQFLGAWSGYLHPSGTYVISSIERGLFVLQPRMVFDGVSGPDSDGMSTENIFLVVIIALLSMVAVLLAVWTFRSRGSNARDSSATL